jgi:hypothetical protein
MQAATTPAATNPVTIFPPMLLRKSIFPVDSSGKSNGCRYKRGGFPEEVAKPE